MCKCSYWYDGDVSFCCVHVKSSRASFAKIGKLYLDDLRRIFIRYFLFCSYMRIIIVCEWQKSCALVNQMCWTRLKFFRINDKFSFAWVTIILPPFLFCGRSFFFFVKIRRKDGNNVEKLRRNNRCRILYSNFEWKVFETFGIKYKPWKYTTFTLKYRLQKSTLQNAIDKLTITEQTVDKFSSGTLQWIYYTKWTHQFKICR